MKADPERFSPRQQAIKSLRQKCSQLGFLLLNCYEIYAWGDDRLSHYDFYVKQAYHPYDFVAKGTLEEIAEFVERCENLKVFL